MADLTPERLAELRAHLAIILEDRHEHEMDGTIDQSHGALTEALPELLDEIDRLRGIKPEIPHRPGVCDTGSRATRFGIRWNGPQSPLAVPMDDGYWTPWHLAQAEIDRLRAVIRSTHGQQCAWPQAFGEHAPTCKLYEIEP